MRRLTAIEDGCLAGAGMARDAVPSIRAGKRPGMPIRCLRLSAIVLVALMLAPGASRGDIGALPPAKIVGGIAYLSGGIGQDEQEAMKSVASHYDLLVTFVESGSGAYISDVRVAIDNRMGERVFEISTEGPLLLVKLPAGRYTVSALNGERLLSRKVTVSGKSSSRVVFQWPAENAE